MIISDEHRFAFVHIPKCAGTSVRSQLAHIDSYHGRFDQIGDHPALGLIDYAHIPLRVLASHFPAEFAKIRAYTSAAVMRNPRERFLSSLMQRMRTWQDAPQSAFTPRALRQEAATVMAHLDAHPDDVGHDFIHFTRQSAYLELDGEQIVRHVFPMQELAAFSAFLQQSVGFSLDTKARVNASLVPKSAWLRGAMNLLRPAYTAVLPARMKNKARSAMLRRKVYGAASDVFLDELLNDAATSAFIADYYRDDIARFNALPGRPEG